MQSNRLALVAPLSVLLAAGGAINFACSNSDDDNNSAKVDSGVYIDGGIQEGVPPGSGYMPPAGGDDDDDDDDSGVTPGGEGGTPPTDGGGDTGTTPPTDAGDAGDSGGGGTAPTTLAVLRLGDGTAALPAATATASASIDFFKVADGTSGGATVSLPTTFSVVYSPSEGGMNRSTDGHYLVFGGVTAAAGTTNAITLPRPIARVSAAGTVDLTTISTAFEDGIRSVASVDGSAFWIVGTGTPNGTSYEAFGNTGAGAVQLETNPGTTRDVGIFAGQLFVSADSTTAPAFDGVGPVGSGTPTTAITGGVASVLPGMTGEPSPYGFVAFDTDTVAGIDVIYIADATDGIEKWHLSGATWSKVGASVAIGAGGARSITGFQNAGAVKLFATSYDGTVVSALSDTVTSTALGTATTLVTAPAKESFRGIAFAAQ